jgi:hypothetical protein
MQPAPTNWEKTLFPYLVFIEMRIFSSRSPVNCTFYILLQAPVASFMTRRGAFRLPVLLGFVLIAVFGFHLSSRVIRVEA